MMTGFVAARAVVFATAFMWAWFWVVFRIQPLSREWDAALPAWFTALGAPLLAAGTIGVVICIALFIVRGRGTPAIFDAPRRFVAVGPYRHVRNPMYLSAAAIFAGFGLSARSLAVLMFAVAWWLLMHAFVLSVEEPGLRRRFGDTYAEYCRQVPRWIPRMLVLAVLLVVTVPLHGQDARPDFNGTWTLNLERSDFGPLPAPQRRTDLVEHREPGLKVTRREVATKTPYEGQEAVVEDRWVLAADRRTLTISRHAVSPLGTADQTFVFERQ